MDSTRISTQADPSLEGNVAATTDNQFTNVEEALARLVHASFPPDARARGPASDTSVDPPVSQSFIAAPPGAGDLGSTMPREQQSIGKPRTRARVAIVVCLAASAIWTWRSYTGQDPTPEPPAASPASAQPPAQASSIAPVSNTVANEPSVPVADHQQIETMARDLASLRQHVEQLAADREQLSRDVDKLQMIHELDKLQMTRQLAKLQTEKPKADKRSAESPARVLPRVRTPHEPSVSAPARKPISGGSTPGHATPQVSILTPSSTPSQPATQSPSAPPFRPPLPVPQP